MHSTRMILEINNSNNHNMIKNPNWEEATSWLFTSVAKDLNSGRPRTNPTKWPEQNSNPGPPDCQSDVLTTWPSCLLSYSHNLTSWYVLVVLGESWWWSHFKGKCGFPLAEEQKKRKTFFSHMAGSMGSSVQGVFRSRGLAFQSSVVFVAFRHCLTFPAHPPCVFWVAGFQVVP